MTRKQRLPASARRAKREATKHHPGEVLHMTKSHENSARTRRRDKDNTSVANVIKTYERAGLITEPEPPTLARSVGDTHEIAAPIGHVLSLYNGLRTDTDIDQFILAANRSLESHQCTEARCLCGRLRRLTDALLDGRAIANHVTPWLENPQHQVPGSACSNER